MCQPKPGPRCVSHVREAIARVERDRARDADAFMNGTGALSKRSYAGELSRLHDEYDETPTGQDELAGAINAAENADEPDLARIDMLRTRLANAAARRAAKTAALKSTQEGNHTAAEFQLRYGANAAWLADSTIHTSEHRHLSADYAIGVNNIDAREEQDGYAEMASYLWVEDKDFTLEAPVQPGPRAGTWIVTSAGPTTSPVPPLLYDKTAGTVSVYDPADQQPHGPITPAATAAGLAVFDRDGYLIEPDDDDTAASVDVDPTTEFRIVETSTGQPMLRIDGHLTFVNARRHIYA